MLGYVKRLNLKGTHWDSTCIHGVPNAGNATVFPHAIALGASFDVDLVRRVGLATATEMRSIPAVCVCMYACMYACMYVRIHMYVRMYVRTA